MKKILMLVVAFICPPLAVGVCEGIKANFWINLILTLLFWIPGFIHAVYLILTKNYPLTQG